MVLIGQWRYTKAYVQGFVSELLFRGTAAQPGPDLDDPEVLLTLAQQEMKETQAKNRERAVQAITQKNILQAETDKTKRIIGHLQAKADQAQAENDKDLEQSLRKEVCSLQETLMKMEASLAHTTERVEQIKVAMRREEERIRAKTVQAMALKTQWKQSQIFAAIDLTADADPENVLKPLRHEIQALRRYAQRLYEEIQTQAERAIQSGNRDLARALLVERASLQGLFAA